MANCWDCIYVNTQMCEGCKEGYMDGADGWIQFDEPTHFIPKEPQAEKRGQITEDVLADFLNRLNTLASDYGLVVGGYQQEEGMLQLLMVKTLGEDGNGKGR